MTESVASYHIPTEDGNLSGGGFSPLPKSKNSRSNTMSKIFPTNEFDSKKVKRKLDERIAIWTLLSLVGATIVLIIYGTIHSTSHEILKYYGEMAQDNLLRSGKFNQTVIQHSNGTIKSIIKSLMVDKDDLTPQFLKAYLESLYGLHSTIFNLIAFNIISFGILVSLHIAYTYGTTHNGSIKVLYRLVIIIILICLLFQAAIALFYLIPTSNDITDGSDFLLEKSKPSFTIVKKQLEVEIDCKFGLDEISIQIGRIDPCLPKIKNSLFSSFSGTLVLLFSILPFILIALTALWDTWLKDQLFIKKGRNFINKLVESN
uniref:Integral membrane protein n=1 Tax=Parastrongyloides trichosuri TaxID=131310 RepID=A0A0N4ZJ72_PARTI